MTQSTPKVLHVLSILVIAVCLLSAGCAVVGAGVGAALGAQADPHHPARGAFIGAAAGAVTGLLFDGLDDSPCNHVIDDQPCARCAY